MPRLHTLALSASPDELAWARRELKYLKLLNGQPLDRAEPLTDRCYLSAEFLDSTEGLFEKVSQLFHNHPCRGLSADDINEEFVARLETTKKTLLEINQSELNHLHAEINLTKCKYALI